MGPRNRSAVHRRSDRRRRFRLLTTGIAALLWTACGAPPPPQPPNVVLILADDLGSGDIGCYNLDSKIPTPNLDQLCAEGIRFTDAHTPSAVCTPTRYGILTGRYAWRTHLKEGVLWGYSPALIEPERPTIASVLKARGYSTAGIGKWHLGLGAEEETDYSKPLRPGPIQAGFDYYFGIPASLDMDPYVYVENEGVVAAPTEEVGRSEMRRRGGGGFWRPGPAAPGFRHEEVLPTFSRKTVEFLNRHKQEKPQTPFFLYLPLSAPHTPWLPTPPFVGRSRAGPYGDFSVQVDHVVGEVMQAVEEIGATDNTLFIFTSDNGAHWLTTDIRQYGHRANHPWRGQKADIWEGGHRVPFLVRWPGRVPAGRVSRQPIGSIDLFATIASLLDVELPPGGGPDSLDVSEAILGREYAGWESRALIHHSLGGMFAIRKGRWKLIEGLGSGGFTAPNYTEPSDHILGQLYDLQEDPREEVNLYGDHPEVVKELTELLDEIRGDELQEAPAM